MNTAPHLHKENPITVTYLRSLVSRPVLVTFLLVVLTTPSLFPRMPKPKSQSPFLPLPLFLLLPQSNLT
jgi:hypothetical protein